MISLSDFEGQNQKRPKQTMMIPKTFRLPPSLVEQIEAQEKPSAYVRNALRAVSLPGKMPSADDRKELAHLMIDLSGVARNVNQIARQLHRAKYAQGVPPEEADIAEAAKSVTLAVRRVRSLLVQWE